MTDENHRLASEMSLKKKGFSLGLLFLLWVIVIAILFGGYELIERFWIDPEKMTLIHTLHILRGIGSSALTALLVGIYLVKWGPSPSIPGDPLSYPMTSHMEIIRKRAVWFVHMRWVAIVLAFLAVVYSTRLSAILPPENFPPLLGCLAVLFLANTSFASLTPRSQKPYRLLMVQTVTDLAVLTFLLHFSGGLENPFFLIYIFHVILAGILLTRRDAALITILTCALFVGLAGGEFLQLVSHSYIGLFPHGPLHTDHAALDLFFVVGRIIPFVLVLCFTAYFAILLQDQIRQDQRHVAQAGKFAAIGELAGRIAHEINNRAGIELLIRQLKGDYPLGKIPTRYFFANEAYFHLLLFAYNLINWFKQLCLPPEFQKATLQTLRHQIFAMPAQLIRAHNRPRLTLPASGRREVAWKHALEKIESLKPLL